MNEDNNQMTRLQYLNAIREQKKTLQQSGSLVNPSIENADIGTEALINTNFNYTPKMNLQSAENVLADTNQSQDNQFGKTLHNVQGFLHETQNQILTGLFKGVEGILDFGANLLGAFGWQEASDWAKKDYSTPLADWVSGSFLSFSGLSDLVAFDENGNATFNNPFDNWGGLSRDDSGQLVYNKEQDPLNYEYQTQAGQFVGGLAQSFGEMLPSIAIGGALGATGKVSSAVAKGVSYTAFGLAAGGNTAEQQLQQGATSQQALASGVISGAVEVASEIVVGKILGDVTTGLGNALEKGGNKGISETLKKVGAYFAESDIGGLTIDKITEKAAKGALTQTAKDVILKLGTQTVEEGVEEVFSDIFQPFVDEIGGQKNSIVTEDGKLAWFTPEWRKQAGESFLSGAVMGALGGGFSEVSTGLTYGKEGKQIISTYEQASALEQERQETYDKAAKETDATKKAEYEKKIKEYDLAIGSLTASLETQLDNLSKKQIENPVKYINTIQALSGVEINTEEQRTKVESELKAQYNRYTENTTSALNSDYYTQWRKSKTFVYSEEMLNDPEKFAEYYKNLTGDEISDKAIEDMRNALKEGEQIHGFHDFTKNGSSVAFIPLSDINTANSVFIHEGIFHGMIDLVPEARKTILDKIKKAIPDRIWNEIDEIVRRDYSEAFDSKGQIINEELYESEMGAHILEKYLDVPTFFKQLDAEGNSRLRNFLNRVLNKIKGGEKGVIQNSAQNDIENFKNELSKIIKEEYVDKEKDYRRAAFVNRVVRKAKALKEAGRKNTEFSKTAGRNLNYEDSEKAIEEYNESETSVQDWEKNAKSYYGTTDKFNDAGYILEDGDMLDFSQGQGRRTLDHRNISVVVSTIYDGYSDGMIDFINRGNIRAKGSYGFEIAQKPTDSQSDTLYDYINYCFRKNGSVDIDIMNKNGDIKTTLSYESGSNIADVLEDINKQFESNTRFSKTKTKAKETVATAEQKENALQKKVRQEKERVQRMFVVNDYTKKIKAKIGNNNAYLIDELLELSNDYINGYITEKELKAAFENEEYINKSYAKTRIWNLLHSQDKISKKTKYDSKGFEYSVEVKTNDWFKYENQEWIPIVPIEYFRIYDDLAKTGNKKITDAELLEILETQRKEYLKVASLIEKDSENFFNKVERKVKKLFKEKKIVIKNGRIVEDNNTKDLFNIARYYLFDAKKYHSLINEKFYVDIERKYGFGNASQTHAGSSKKPSSLKSVDSFADRLYRNVIINKKKLNPRDLHDFIRGTWIVSEENFQKVLDAFGGLEEYWTQKPVDIGGSELLKYDEKRKTVSYDKEKDTLGVYKGLHLNFIYKGIPIEVQVHTKRSWEIKLRQDKFYDATRSYSTWKEAKNAIGAEKFDEMEAESIELARSYYNEPLFKRLSASFFEMRKQYGIKAVGKESQATQTPLTALKVSSTEETLNKPTHLSSSSSDSIKRKSVQDSIKNTSNNTIAQDNKKVNTKNNEIVIDKKAKKNNNENVKADSNFTLNVAPFRDGDIRKKTKKEYKLEITKAKEAAKIISEDFGIDVRYSEAIGYWEGSKEWSGEFFIKGKDFSLEDAIVISSIISDSGIAGEIQAANGVFKRKTQIDDEINYVRLWIGYKEGLDVDRVIKNAKIQGATILDKDKQFYVLTEAENYIELYNLIRKEIGEEYFDESRTEKEDIYGGFYSKDGRRIECQKWLETHKNEKGRRRYNYIETAERRLGESIEEERKAEEQAKASSTEQQSSQTELSPVNASGSGGGGSGGTSNDWKSAKTIKVITDKTAKSSIGLIRDSADIHHQNKVVKTADIKNAIITEIQNALQGIDDYDVLIDTKDITQDFAELNAANKKDLKKVANNIVERIKNVRIKIKDTSGKTTKVVPITDLVSETEFAELGNSVLQNLVMNAQPTAISQWLKSLHLERARLTTMGKVVRRYRSFENKIDNKSFIRKLNTEFPEYKPLVSLLINSLGKYEGIWTVSGRGVKPAKFKEIASSLNAYTKEFCEKIGIPFNEDFANLIQQMNNETIGKTLTVEQLEMVDDLYQMANHILSVLGSKAHEERKARIESTKIFLDSLEEIIKTPSGIQALIQIATNENVSVFSIIEHYFGKNNEVYRILEEYNKAHSNTLADRERYKKYWDTTDKQLKKDLLKKINWTVNGKTFTITQNFAISILKTYSTSFYQNEDGSFGNSFLENGFKLYDEKSALKIASGKITEDEIIKLNYSISQNVSEYCSKVSNEFLNGIAKEETEKAYYDFNGVELSLVPNYYPTARSLEQSMAQNKANTFEKPSTANWSAVQERKRNNNPYVIKDFTTTVKQYSDGLAFYKNMTRYLQEFNYTFNMRVDGKTLISTMEGIIPRFGDIFSYLQDIVAENRIMPESKTGKNKLLGLIQNAAVSTLSFRISPVLKQFLTGINYAINTKTGEIDFKSFRNAMLTAIKNAPRKARLRIASFIAENSPTINNRWLNREALTAETGKVIKSKIADIGTKNMEEADKFLITTLGWAVAVEQSKNDTEYWQKQNIANPTEDEIWKHAIPFIENIVAKLNSNSMPMYMSMVRSGRKGIPTMLLFGLFQADNQVRIQEWRDTLFGKRRSSQRISAYKQAINKAEAKIAELRQKADDTKKVLTDKDKVEAEIKRYEEMISEFKQNITNEEATYTNKRVAIKLSYMSAGLVVNALIAVLINALSRRILGKDDWDEWDWEDFWKDFSSEMFSPVPYVNSIANNLISGYDFSVLPLDKANSLLSAAKNLTSSIKDGNTDRLSGSILEFIRTFGDFAGVPISNIHDLVQGTIYNINHEAGYTYKHFTEGLTTSVLKSKISDSVSNGSVKNASSAIRSWNTLYGITNMSDSVSKEIATLKIAKENVSLHEIPSEYTNSDGQTVKMTKAQISNFTRLFSNAEKELEELIKTKEYTNADNSTKASLMNKILNAYYSYAKARIFGLETTGSKIGNLILFTNGKFENVSEYLSILQTISMITATKTKTRKEMIIRYLNKQSLSKNEKMLILSLAGFSLADNNKNSMTSFLVSLGMKRDNAKSFLNI